MASAPGSDVRSSQVSNNDSRQDLDGQSPNRECVLYITHDGIADHIGQSQIAPYLVGLVRLGHRIVVVSLEKPEKADAVTEAGREFCEAGINWTWRPYHRRPALAAALWDLLQLRRAAYRHARDGDVTIVHCRGYIASLVGMYLKRKCGLKFIFDMRGLWPDESKENGRLRIETNWVHRLIYRYFKWKERQFLEEADHIISLTQAGIAAIYEVATVGGVLVRAPITVIPCCADFNLFDRARLDPSRVAFVRKALGIEPDAFVLVYLGSLSPVGQFSLYRVKEMMAFFAVLRERCGGAKFLIIANNNHEVATAAAVQEGVGADEIVVLGAKREEVPYLIAQGDLGVFFIGPTPERRTCSPTKLAELFAMDVPAVGNWGVGDLDIIMDSERNGSAVVRRFDKAEYRRVIDLVLKRKVNGVMSIRSESRAMSLESGVLSYHRVYEQVASRTGNERVNAAIPR